MKGVFTVDKLKDVNQVTVINGKDSIHFNRMNGMWSNHIKGEKLSDDGMGKLLANYEEFGWGTIWPEPNAGFASDKQNPEQIDVGMDEDQAGELVVPEGAWMVVVSVKGDKDYSYIHDIPLSEFSGKQMYQSPFGGHIELSELRAMIFSRMEKGFVLRAQSYDKNHKAIGFTGRKA